MDILCWKDIFVSEGHFCVGRTCVSEGHFGKALKKSNQVEFFFVCALIQIKMVLFSLPGHKESIHMLSIQIRPKLKE